MASNGIATSIATRSVFRLSKSFMQKKYCDCVLDRQFSFAKGGKRNRIQ